MLTLTLNSKSACRLYYKSKTFPWFSMVKENFHYFRNTTAHIHVFETCCSGVSLGKAPKKALFSK